MAVRMGERRGRLVATLSPGPTGRRTAVLYVHVRTLSPMVWFIVSSTFCCVLTRRNLTSGCIVVPCRIHTQHTQCRRRRDTDVPLCRRSFMLLTTVILIIIINFPSPAHSFIPGLKPSLSANPSHHSFSFSSSGLTTWKLTFTATSEHIRFFTFYSFSVLHFLN